MTLTKTQFHQLKTAYIHLKQAAFAMNHYDLASNTLINDPQLWKEFLMTPEIADYKSNEMALIREATINQIAQDAGSSNSVGKAQLLNALQKIDEKTMQKDGPAFIYCYVPPNEQQTKAPNYRTMKHTPEGGIEFDE